MSTVWVATSGVDSEGGSVIGVASTADGAQAIAEREEGRSLDWHRPRGQHDCWTARSSEDSIYYYEVTPWEVAGAPVDIDALLADIPEVEDPDPPHPSECGLWPLFPGLGHTVGHPDYREEWKP